MAMRIAAADMFAGEGNVQRKQIIFDEAQGSGCGDDALYTSTQLHRATASWSEPDPPMQQQPFNRPNT